MLLLILFSWNKRGNISIKQRAKKRALKKGAKEKLKVSKKSVLNTDDVESEDEVIGSAGEEIVDSSEEGVGEKRDGSSDSEDGSEELDEPQILKENGYTDDNKEWLKPKLGKRKAQVEENSDIDDESSDEDENLKMVLVQWFACPYVMG